MKTLEIKALETQIRRRIVACEKKKNQETTADGRHSWDMSIIAYNNVLMDIEVMASTLAEIE